MERRDVERLLRTRFNMTSPSQRFGEDTVEAWHALLVNVDATAAIEALHRLIAEGARHVALGDLLALTAPRHRAEPYQTPDWSGPTDEGRAALRRILAHLRDGAPLPTGVRP